MKNISGNKGSILVTLLWITALLGLFAMGIGFRASIEARLSKYNKDLLQARYKAKSGITKAIKHIAENIEEYDSAYTLNSQIDSVTVTDEQARLNINLAKLSGEDTVNYYKTMHMLSDELDVGLVNALIDWQDADESVTQPGGYENFDYTNEFGYNCKNKDFESVHEIMLVKGITREIYRDIFDEVTVFGDGPINVNTASLKVLKAVLDDGTGIYSNLAMDIANNRTGVDGILGTLDDKVFKEISDLLDDPAYTAEKSRLTAIKDSLTVKSGFYRIKSTGSFGKANKTIECVVQKESNEKVSIVFYHET